ncbi:UvrABC system protein A [Candidatus Protochlamydia amoebophila]|uniref:excinuclease ABC subunit UvrA n=1 Tax=Candidatus Protochlamydia amoebophila TaxID=362787 RepID=UPI001BC9CCE1|nr:excinuclease ABC subunit UvrA [Candidatus Protochlamydia amoebophila]MBS4164590.1 UvrABC system protein A [Candidatus Protochlamydia amoebophila]
MSVFSYHQFINLQGCKEHNLKNLSVQLPKHAITVITGVSGSGKSSLAFDTLFAEGQRRYLEYLSPQARSWIKQMPKPDVDLIEGLSPTLAIGQHRQPLYFYGTVATYTNLYDFLSLLYAKIGDQYSPATGKKLSRFTRQEMIDWILKNYSVGSRLQLIAPIKLIKENGQQAITRLQQMGFIRMRINEQEWCGENPFPINKAISNLEVVVDRLEIREGIRDRLAPSVETALDLSQGILKIQEGKEGNTHYLTEIYVCPETGFSFAPLEVGDFNFNSPKGACAACNGLGGREQVNPSQVIFDENEPLLNQIQVILDHLPKKAAYSFKSLLKALWKILNLSEENFIKDISQMILSKILFGHSQEIVFNVQINEESEQLKAKWKGLIPVLNEALEVKKNKGSLSELSFIDWQTCSSCLGGRLKPESLACLIQENNIYQLCSLTVAECLIKIKAWLFTGKQEAIVKEILPHIQSRLEFLDQVGLGYLTLTREGKTLSDGEAHRIQLASQIGAKLSGIIYILDEPSLGLHRQDIQHLHKVIHELKVLGNTVVIVEHEKSLIQQADYILELGPGAGSLGGQICFQGTIADLLNDSNSLTGKWLSGKLSLPIPPRRKIQQGWLEIRGATLNNLNDFSANIPLGCFVGFCGVSGSGKSTLVLDIIGQQLKNFLARGIIPHFLNKYQTIKRLISHEKQTDCLSARSIPATYIGIMTPLRQLFAETRLAKARGYTASRFSLNKRGGRCEACEGLGYIEVNMHLMPDFFMPCDICQGLRYNYETLQITWENKNIADILRLSALESFQLFKHIPSLAPTLELMTELGLDYLQLGQPFNTLSGGEIQRLKLIADLAGKTQEKTLYILDEPSSGLHLQDIEKLVKILHKLVEKGHTVFVIEHHLDILYQADWLIELGPEGGPKGGKLIFEGPSTKMIKAHTPTGKVFSQFNQ